MAVMNEWERIGGEGSGETGQPDLIRETGQGPFCLAHWTMMRSLDCTQSAIGNLLRGFKERSNTIRFLFIKATMASMRRLG